MRIALAQLAVIDGNVQMNVQRAETLVRQSVEDDERPDIVLLPELWSTGYAYDQWDSVADNETARVEQHLSVLAQELKVAIGGSMVTRRDDGKLVNRFSIVSPGGSVSGRYDKSHLFAPMREPEFLAPGSTRVHTVVGEDRPTDAAMSICYDLRFPGMYRASAHQGVGLFLVVSAWPEPRCTALRTLSKARAIENLAFLAICNRVGPAADGTQFCGGSMIISPTGDVLLDLGSSEGVGAATIRTRESAAARAMLRVLDGEIEGVDFDG